MFYTYFCKAHNLALHRKFYLMRSFNYFFRTILYHLHSLLSSLAQMNNNNFFFEIEFIINSQTFLFDKYFNFLSKNFLKNSFFLYFPFTFVICILTINGTLVASAKTICSLVISTLPQELASFKVELLFSLVNLLQLFVQHICAFQLLCLKVHTYYCVLNEIFWHTTSNHK